MSNFVRALKMSRRYPWTIAGIVSSALVVAILWGGNIGAMWPVLEVTFQGKSLNQWVDSSIADSERLSAELETEIDGVDQEISRSPADKREQLERQRDELAARQSAEEKALGWYRWIKPGLDRWSPSDPFQTLVVLISALMIGTIIKDLLMAVGQMLVDRLTALVMLDLRKQFYRQTLRMDLPSFGEAGTSDLLSRFTYDIDGIGGGISVIFSRTIREPLKMIACLVGAAWICWRLLLLSLDRRAAGAGHHLAGWPARPSGPIAGRWSRCRRSTTSWKRPSAASRSSRPSPWSATNAGGSTTSASNAFARACGSPLRFARQSDHRGHGHFHHLPGDAGRGLAGAQARDAPVGHPHVRAAADDGLALVFYGFLAGTADPVRKFSEVFSRLQRAAAASDRIYHLLDREPSMSEPAATRPAARHHRDLVFDGISFAYQPGHPVLSGINLRIPFGETIAIVGPNGCGKSTLANLIPRFADPTRGRCGSTASTFATCGCATCGGRSAW